VSIEGDQTIMALDVGSVRIGVARAYIQTLFPQPFAEVHHDSGTISQLKSLFDQEHAIALVVGLPRSLDSHETGQTQAVRDFVHKLKEIITLPLYYQDEAGTSKKAQAELSASKTKRRGPSASIDALAATYILEDFIEQGRHNDVFNKKV
jgi:putative Holliday junction resolvase